MKVQIEKKTRVTVQLNEEEARLLKSMIQNGPPDEGVESREFRGELFEKLRKAVGDQ